MRKHAAFMAESSCSDKAWLSKSTLPERFA